MKTRHEILAKQGAERIKYGIVRQVVGYHPNQALVGLRLLLGIADILNETTALIY